MTSAPSIETLLRKYDRPVPRYTSYPTAVQFDQDITADMYAAHLGGLPAESVLSLYLHIPFCQSLCRYCGCFTKVPGDYAPVRAYVGTLIQEIRLVAEALGRRKKVSHIHFGGGSPNYLEPEDVDAVFTTMRACFNIAPNADIAVEMDPRLLGADKIAAYAQAGVNRASLGVQDFNPSVQEAIGRIQPFDNVAACVANLREAGIGRINFDLIYGLPLQNEDSIRETAALAASLEPSRMALFAYAHVPWIRPQQKTLEPYGLPDTRARHAMNEAARAALGEHGYTAIGIDHFVRPGDSLHTAWQNGRLHRNFQGYTDDTADWLIGFGASSIGSLPQAYVQNTPKLKEYRTCVEDGQLPVARGRALTSEDRVRRRIIESLLCYFQADIPEGADFGPAFARLSGYEADGLAYRDGRRVFITEDGRTFARLVASCFDAYLEDGEGRHARAV